MFKLRTGYFIAGITTGLVLLASFLLTLPDGKLHIVFCDVGQGDAAYIRFPDGRDMVVDGGPNDKIVGCLGRHMPFWDRKIDMVLMTHPQKDHMQGLISVLERFGVGYFVRSDVANTTEGYQKLVETIKQKHVPVKLMLAGDHIGVGTTSLSFLWPSAEQIAKGREATQAMQARPATQVIQENTLGASIGLAPPGDLNDYCLVFVLRYGSFDAVFTGDADMRVEGNYTGAKLADDSIEVLKVPHHGSRTGMTEQFILWLRPKLAVISVGKNSYGHPADEALRLLKEVGSKIERTDQKGDFEIVSDGNNWGMEKRK